MFRGEKFTKKNTRHCVNSISLDFVKDEQLKSKSVIFAGGCFWGVEYHFSNTKGVIQAISGYTGGKTKNPSYKEVCRGDTGHVEAVKVLYDDKIIKYEELVKIFFEIHDFEQEGGQGPDIGEQYESYIFYNNEKEKQIAQKTINTLKKKGYTPVTKLRKAKQFYKAENHHQDYYAKKGGEPYCHARRKVF